MVQDLSRATHSHTHQSGCTYKPPSTTPTEEVSERERKPFACVLPSLTQIRFDPYIFYTKTLPTIFDLSTPCNFIPDSTHTHFISSSISRAFASGLLIITLLI
ncbi:hypothetical protein L1887_12549 [Cichorium endivia]|nr:hypothetical protein L1887_12549 [Cichorium endivia]